jgi:anti-sigma factor RsiW
MDCNRCAQLLSAHLDQELPACDEAGLLAHLQGCARCTGEWQELQALRAGLQACARRHPAPSTLFLRVQSSLAGLPPDRHPGSAPNRAGKWLAAWRPVVAGAVLGALGMGLGAGWWQPSIEQDMSEAAASAYLRSTRLPAEGGLRSNDARVLAAWLQTQLQREVAVPDLRSSGYQLVGARLDFLYRQQVVALVYRTGAHVVNVYLWPQGRQATLHATLAEDGLQLRFWTRQGQHRCAISDLDAAALQRFVLAFDA